MAPRWFAPRSRSQPQDRFPIDSPPGQRFPFDESPKQQETAPTPKWKDFNFMNDGLPARPPVFDDIRPRTSAGPDDRAKSRTKPQTVLPLLRPRTSDGPSPSSRAPFVPFNTQPTPSKVDHEAIGMAFGSPTHPPNKIFGTLNDLTPSNYEESVFEQQEPVYQMKGRTSKWKKLGALFKSTKSSAIQPGAVEIPFYKVRAEEKPHEDFLTRRSPTPPPKDEDRRNSITARLAEARLEVARLEEIIAAPAKLSSELSKDKKEVSEKSQIASKLRSAMPKLEVSIPTITMDRYSEMFSSHQDSKPHSKLLARRSKTLERLKSVNDQESEVTDEIATPDTSTLLPRLEVPRRATSPSSSNKSTGGFLLFPQATKPALGTPSPKHNLRRSMTSPARLSPMTETFKTENPQSGTVNRSEVERTVVSPGETTASTDPGRPWSVDPCPSPTTTVTTIDEENLLSPPDVIAKPQIEIEKSTETSIVQETIPDPAVAADLLISPLTKSQDDSEISDKFRITSTILHGRNMPNAFNGRITSNVFNKAIAEIEALAVCASQPLPPGAAALAKQSPDAHMPNNGSVSPDTTEKPQVIHSKHISNARLMMMNMPSPITEAPEESPAPSPAKILVKTEKSITTPSLTQSNPPSKTVARMETKISTPPPSQSNPPARNLPNAEKTAESLKRTPSPDYAIKSDEITPPAPMRAPPPVPLADTTSPQEQSPALKSANPTFKATPTVLLAKSWPPRGPASLAASTKPKSPFQIPIKSKISAIPPPQSPTAPPVPRKDPDHTISLPISRFAAKNTAANVTSKTGIRPGAPIPKNQRSATEPTTLHHVGESYRGLRSVATPTTKSSSEENSQRDVTNSAGKGVATSQLEKMRMDKSDVMPATATVKPVPNTAGETVGIARTVSLSRKQSLKVLVRRKESSPGPVVAEKGGEDEEKEKEQKEGDEEDKPRRPRAGTAGGLRRSDSFKHATKVGKDEVKNSGVERARALSPIIQQVATSGHKIARSNVGIVEDA